MSAALSLCDRYLGPGQRFVDFGAGTGHLVRELAGLRPDAHVEGFEPFMDPGSDARISKTTDGLTHRTYDVVGAFEVLEHLDGEDLDRFHLFVADHLAPDGHLIVSVPNMLGPILLVKYLNFRFVNRTDWAYSLRDVARAAFLLRSPDRGAAGASGYLGHRGFDWRALRRDLSAVYTLCDQVQQPFPRLWWGLNSQWFGIFRVRR